MKKLITAALPAMLAAVALAPAPAMAGSAEGKLQVKVLGTGVLPDGKIVAVKNDPLALTTGAQTKANDNYVPTLAVEYFLTPNVSAETICCFTQHHVSGVGALAPATNIVDHVLVLPATLTLKYHLPLGKGIKPYVGAGPSLFLIFGEKPGSSITGLGVTKVKMSNNVGFALQAGVDVALNDKGLGLSIDAKKYFQDTNAHFYAGNTEVLTTKHSLDPWVLSAGVAYRF
ncbi:OmpW/AlkL family protein [Novosphingobium jiangmenense]|uniref:Outer membrane beta-barrel protein n=1 Tax=Novosphingobium jiangmenense TaxID=2791981 RepID=A0ABS0HHW1_9SPHN|nr:OmpW family outer membrane protein [Novosphingobium jiangmenense]MBF9151848.1 outer membrane beta-barrel protein [Novosphingobium jiangmenense]